MQTVNIYIASSIKGPRRRHGAYLYLLEVETNKGPATVNKMGILEDTTENQLTVTALEQALKRIKKPCSLQIYLDCNYVAAVLKNGWLEDWRYRDWQTKNGKPICDVEIWRSISFLLNAHEFSILEKEQYSYREWMGRVLKEAESNGTG